MQLPEKLFSVIIENVQPEIDGGYFPVKRIIGESVDVKADIFREGHYPINAHLKYRKKGVKQWSIIKMQEDVNDLWQASFYVLEPGIYEYTIEARPKAPLSDTRLITKYKILEVFVDRKKAEYASWYEMWPRSQGVKENMSATFDDMIKRIPYVKDLGFDVIYITPIHPIGETHRKGANNSAISKSSDPGCPYAIGNKAGGHRSIQKDLGTMNDFKRFVKEADKLGIEIALDIAHTVSPDHPYVKKHPEWFYKNPDGTIKCAENPPKVYEDIYPFNFYNEKWQELWRELRDIFIFWIKKGIKIFRIDNPHTKPFLFWKWVLREIKEIEPEVIFLAEAFTRPKVMKHLAKCGFSESYTYFTWRNHKQEIIDYFTELTKSEMSQYFKGNLFTNTPDILPEILQKGGRPAFKMRLVLAATLSSVYGIYNGYELCENKAIPGKEEYINSEKYQYKVWDWDRKGNIKDLIRRVNYIRRENPALHFYRNLNFYRVDHESVIFYGKKHENNIILVAVNLNPFEKIWARLEIPIWEYNIGYNEEYDFIELLSNTVYKMKGSEFWVDLDPNWYPAKIFNIKKRI